MRSQILQFPKQIPAGIELADNVKINKNYERVVICGMGGSIIPAEFLLTSLTLNEGPTKYFINRDYGLPGWTNKNDLVICISWSGNTAETISSYNTAIKLGADTAVITKGGQLMAKALLAGDRIKFIRLPDDKIPPRIAVGYMAGALFGLLGIGEELSFELKSEESEKEGQNIASQMGNKIPIVYAPFRWRKLAGLWKVLFNENAKTPSFWNFFPSAAHNEIAGFNEHLRNTFYPILIKDSGREDADINAAIAIFKNMGYNYSIVNLSASGKVSAKDKGEISPQGGGLEKTLNNYILGLWASYYLAKELGINPTDTAQIENFKRLKNKPIPKIRLAK